MVASDGAADTRLPGVGPATSMADLRRRGPRQRPRTSLRRRQDCQATCWSASDSGDGGDSLRPHRNTRFAFACDPCGAHRIVATTPKLASNAP